MCCALNEPCFESEFTPYCHRTMQQIRKPNTTLKSLLWEINCRTKNLKILQFNIDLEKSPKNLRCKGVWYIMHGIKSGTSNRTI